MTSHPNRSTAHGRAGRSPKPREIAQLREEMEMTQTQFARHLYCSLATVQAWEYGTRTMPALAWEYCNLLWAYPQVERVRALWIEGRADVPVA